MPPIFQGTLPLPRPFSLGLTLLCGQCFRWDKAQEEGWFQGVAGGAYWRLRQEGNSLHWECSSGTLRGKTAADWLSNYLSLDEDLGQLAQAYGGHPVMGEPLRALPGLRLLRQEPWECSISYMFAQGLSVKVIRQALRKFCVEYGAAISGVPGAYGFPEPGDLAGLSADFLRPFTNNYRDRADRIIRIARAVQARVISLDHLKGISCDEAREALMALDGIGPKIADCILLFSLDHVSAFPVDRWVLRAMKKYFRSVRFLGPGEEAPTRTQYLRIVQKARSAFGDRCGILSEYLFLYLRLLEDAKLREELEPYCRLSAPPAPPVSKGRSPKSPKNIAFRAGKAL